MSDTDAQITLPTLDRPTTVPRIDIEKADALVLAGTGGAGLFVSLYLQLGLLTVPAVVLGLGAGLLILLAAPSHLTGLEYLRIVGGALRTSSQVSNAAPEATTGDGVLRSLFQRDRTTRTRTHVQQYYPGRNVIKRDEGRLAAALRLDPQGMDFAQHEDWARLTSTLESLANDALDFPIQIYVTTRPFSDDYLESLEQRLDDPDVEADETLQTLIGEYVETRRTDFETTTTAPPHVYAVVDVGDDEVLDETVGETTGLERLAQVPLVGILFSWVVRSRAAIDETERLDRMCDELDRRLHVLSSNWTTVDDTVCCERLSLAEWLPLIEEFWTGERAAAADEDMVRSTPVVTAPGASSAERVSQPRQTSDVVDDEDAATGAVTEESRLDDEIATATATEAVPSLAEVQQRQLAPAGVEEAFETIRTGETHRQVLYIEGWPDTIGYGALRRLFQRSDIEYDLSIQLRPVDRSMALDRSETRYRSLKGDAKLDESDLSAAETRSKADETALFRQQIKAGQSAFRVAVYVVARADDEDTLQEVSRELRSRVRDPPAEASLKTLTGEQLLGLESAAPVGRDVVADHGTTDTSAVLLGRGVGALLASIQDSGLVDPSGIELGEHAVSGKPVIIDPFETGVNYNWTVIGDSGTGKTYFGALSATRALMRDRDTTVVFIDPMQAFEGVARALDADTIRVGGQQSLNPLEIRPPADGGDRDLAVDPLRQKIQEVLSLFDNFAHQQGIEGGLGEARSLLSTALEETYERAGITHDVATHDRESPTIADLLDVLQTMADSPGEYILRTSQETKTISQYATRLLGLLRPFVDGEYSHLSESSSLEFGDSDVIYMDMSEEEGRTGGGGGLTMQLVFSQAYEFAKERTEQVIIVIDEARFFMRHSINLDFLGQRVRHSRHFDTSIRFYTQNINDFYAHSEAESIINNSAIKVFHNVEEIDEWRDVFDLNDREVEFVRSAATGSEGYSEALLDITGRRLPLQIFATPLEDQLIDFDPNEDSLPEILGTGKPPGGGRQGEDPDPIDNPDSAESAATTSMTTEAAPATSIDWVAANADPALVEEWRSLCDSHREAADLLTGPELAEVLRTIRDAQASPAAVLATALEAKLATLAETDVGDRLDPAETLGGDATPETLVDIDTETLADPAVIEDPTPSTSGNDDSLTEMSAGSDDPTVTNDEGEDALPSGRTVSDAEDDSAEPSHPTLSEEDLHARWNERLAELAEQARQVTNSRSEQNSPLPPNDHDGSNLDSDQQRHADDSRDAEGDSTWSDSGSPQEDTTLSQDELKRADAAWIRRFDAVFFDSSVEEMASDDNLNGHDHEDSSRLEPPSRENEALDRWPHSRGPRDGSEWSREGDLSDDTEETSLYDDEAWPDVDSEDE